jgi:hypothetical protein
MEQARNLQVLRNFRTNESSKSRNANVTAVRVAWDGWDKELHQGAAFVVSGSGVCDIRERSL